MALRVSLYHSFVYFYNAQLYTNDVSIAVCRSRILIIKFECRAVTTTGNEYVAVSAQPFVCNYVPSIYAYKSIGV